MAKKLSASKNLKKRVIKAINDGINLAWDNDKLPELNMTETRKNRVILKTAEHDVHIHIFIAPAKA